MFECLRCGYSSNLKTNIVRHLKRKRPCKVTLLDVECSVLLDEIKGENRAYEKIEYLVSRSKPKVSRSKPAVNQSKPAIFNFEKHKNHEKIPDELRCKYCYKIFKQKQGKSRHEKHRCKKNTNYSRIQKLEYENKLLKSELVSTKQVINNISNTISNTINNTNSNNTNTVNININGLGNERVEHLLPFFKENIHRFIKLDPEYFAEYVKQKHFNPDVPENHNIKCTNKKENEVMVWSESKKSFELQQKKQTSYKVYKNLISDIDLFVEELLEHKKRIQYINATKVIGHQKNAMEEYEGKTIYFQPCQDYISSVKRLETAVKAISYALYNETKLLDSKPHVNSMEDDDNTINK